MRTGAAMQVTQSLMKSIIVICLCLALFGCMSIDVDTSIDDEVLLDGSAAFGETLAPAPPVDMLALDEDMQAFVARHTAGSKHARVRLDQLLRGMIDEGLLTLDYDEQLTQTAQATFRSREGNCLSFSTLFVALAREAGLDARFQMVDVPPTFTDNGETIVVNNHINILVQQVREGTRYFRDRVIDFNTAEYNGSYDMWPVSDEYAQALFHSNLAVEAMGRGDWRDAFAQLKRAALTEPDIADVWVNLGVVYARMDVPALAIDAYHRALSLDERHATALANLARAYERAGNAEQAARFRARVEYHLKRNPYYLQMLAKTALENDEPDRALDDIGRAIRIKPGEHQFHFTRAIALYRLGERHEAESELERAAELAMHPWLERRYAEKLSALRQ